MGVELSHDWRHLGIARDWRYRCYGFFAAFSPFFFLKGHFACAKSSLAGDETHKPRTRYRCVQINSLARNKMHDPKTRKVPRMRLQKLVEKRTQKRVFWDHATLLLQKLWTTLFLMVAILPFPFFFLRETRFQNVSLAGDGKYESKNRQLRREKTESETSRVPQMPLPKSKKRWPPSMASGEVLQRYFCWECGYRMSKW